MCLAFFPQSAVDDNGYVPLVNAKDRLHHKHDQKTPLRMSEISLKTQLLLEKMMLLIISIRNEVFFLVTLWTKDAFGNPKAFLVIRSNWAEVKSEKFYHQLNGSHFIKKD